MVKVVFQGILPALSGFKYADKVTHFIYGLVITATVAYFATYPIFSVTLIPAICAVIASIFIAVAKEYYDKKYRTNCWDNGDLIATILPSIFYLIFYLS